MLALTQPESPYPLFVSSHEFQDDPDSRIGLKRKNTKSINISVWALLI